MTEPTAEDTVSSTTPDGPAAFTDFYRAHWAPLTVLCHSYLGSRARAEEVAQEALFVAHRRWGRVSRLDRPDLWLRRVATNMCISSWRRRRNEVLANERHARGTGHSTPSVEPPDDELWQAVRRLPKRQRAAIGLHYLDGLTTAEVGEVLGCSASTVQTHLGRARATLRAAGLEHDGDAASATAPEGRS
ncbi:MAG: SigE family RNA polymerase sigma factor [Microthrixaceae bacterium]|nr:SigE family RNA polymerase sigma factor [Microthrixaceae bacterium]